MVPATVDFLIKRFEQPDEIRMFTKGNFEIVMIMIQFENCFTGS
jgi:hypothetical protein